MGAPVIGDSRWDDTGPNATASEAATGFPARHLLLNGFTKRWESINTLGIKWLRFVAPEVRSVSCVQLAGHNASRHGTFRTVFERGGSVVYDTASFGPAMLSIQNEHPNPGTALGLTAATFSIEFWLYPFHANGHGIVQRVGGTDAPTLSINPSGLPIFRDEPNRVSTLTAASRITARRWIHVAGTLSGTTAHLILHDSDGTMIQDVSATVSGWDAGTELLTSPTIGTLGGYDGYLNELRLWNVARTEAQIRADLFERYTGTEGGGLLGVWGGEAPDSGSLTNRVAAGPALALAHPYYAFGSTQRTGLWPTSDLDDEEWRDAFVHVPEGIHCDAIQVYLLDPFCEEERLRVSRVVISEAMQFPRYPSVSGTMFASYVDYSPTERNILGQESGYRLPPKREFVAHLGSEEAWVWNVLARMYNRAGATGDLTAIMNPDAETVDEMNLGIRRFTPSFQVPYRSWEYRDATLNLRSA